MPRPGDLQKLISAIRDLLQAGFPVDSSVRRFAASMGKEATPAFFKCLLTEDEEDDAASLMELLFSPSEEMQMLLEPLLDKARFDGMDEAALIGELMENPPLTRIIFSEVDALMLPLPPAVIPTFLSRLRITRHLSPRLNAVIDSETDLPERFLFKVRLRNSHDIRLDAEIQFLCLFFQKIRGTSVDPIAAFNLLLSFLEAYPDEADYRSALIRAREKYSDIMTRAEHFEQRLQRFNMETLMLQGDRPPVMGVFEAYERKRGIEFLLDRIYGTGWAAT